MEIPTVDDVARDLRIHVALTMFKRRMVNRDHISLETGSPIGDLIDHEADRLVRTWKERRDIEANPPVIHAPRAVARILKIIKEKGLINDQAQK